MWPRPRLCSGRRLVVLLLLVQHHVMASQAATVAQLKNQQHHQQQQQHQSSAILGQTTHQQQQRHYEQSQQQQQPKHSTVTTHPDSLSSSNSGHHHVGTATTSSSSSASASSSSSSSAPLSSLPPAQFSTDKETAAATAAVQEVFKHYQSEDDLSDTYQILTELKREANSNSLPSPPPPPHPSSAAFLSHPSSSPGYPWNLFERAAFTPVPFGSIPVPPIAGIFPHMFGAFDGYPTPFPVTPRFMPIMSYPQPVLVPYPFYMAPEMFYPGFSALPNGLNDFEESMSRGAAATRRPAPNQHATGYSRNSPIYYVRLPPTPYMFMPSLGLGASSPAMSGFPTMLPYQTMPSFPSYSSVFNVPLNFLANGKPSNIYQMGGSPNDIQGPMQYPINNRPAAAAAAALPSPSDSYRPASSSNHQYFNSPSANSYGSYPSPPVASSTSSASLQDSKLTSLKRPYYFNGRPEDIYILPNNFNPLYSSDNSYY